MNGFVFLKEDKSTLDQMSIKLKNIMAYAHSKDRVITKNYLLFRTHQPCVAPSARKYVEVSTVLGVSHPACLVRILTKTLNELRVRPIVVDLELLREWEILKESNEWLDRN